MPQKRVFLIHAWGGKPGDVWFPWLKRELEKRGFIVIAPEMPDTETPKIENWVPYLAKLVGEPDEDTYFLGHSIGCQTIARYLAGLPEEKKAGGVVFVAGFAEYVTGLTEEEQVIMDSWTRTPIDWSKVRNHAKKFVAIHSDNDPYVPLDNAKFFKEKLGAEVSVEQGKGHFDEESGVTELPSALHAILNLANAV